MSDGVLTLRAGAEAGGPEEVRVLRAPLPAEVWIVYVHGFNVGARAADQQLDELRKRSAGRFVLGAGGAAWVVYRWPSRVTGSRAFNRITYPLALERVPAAGNLLGDFLARLSVRHVVLVGNSLGAHVVLKAARRMKDLDRPPDGVALLAAAVATDAVSRSGDYGIPQTDHESVTVNPDDKILRRVFGAGERAARPFASTPHAVGLTGDPVERTWKRVPLDGSAHAAYGQKGVEIAVAAACNARLVEPEGRGTRERDVPGNEPPRWDPS